MSGSLIDEELLLSLIEGCRHRDGAINSTKLAKESGYPRTSVQNALARLGREGRLGTRAVLPGFAIKSISEQLDVDGLVQKTYVKQGLASGEEFKLPEGQAIKGISTLVGADGNILQQWVKTKAEIDPRALVDGLEAAFKEFTPAAKPSPPPDCEFIDQLSAYPWSDPHFGLMIWGKEASADWDLKISVRVIKDAFAKVVARTPRTKRALLLIGGDTIHSDTNDNRTLRSGNPLQVDGRYPKIVLTACETAVENIDLLLTHHDEIDVIVLGGNHDEHASYAVTFFLHAWYRNEPRVKIDISPSLFRFREFGRVMIGTTHGHTVKIKDFPAVMAATQPEMWGRTRHRFALGFHLHHAAKTLSEGGGVITETFQIISPADAWHFGQGYTAGRSIQSIVYDREHGEVGRSRVAVV